MMKKFLACVLAGTMVVASLTACGSTQSAEGTTATTEETTEAGSSETAEAAEETSLTTRQINGCSRNRISSDGIL